TRNNRDTPPRHVPENGSAARIGDSGQSRREGDVLGHAGLELDGRQTAQAGLATSPVVGALDPGDDRDAQLLAGGPGSPVEDVLLQEREEALHRGVVARCADSAHRADHAVAADLAQELPAAELT